MAWRALTIDGRSGILSVIILLQFGKSVLAAINREEPEEKLISLVELDGHEVPVSNRN